MTDNLSKSIQSTEHELSWANRGLKGNNADDVKELCDEIERCDQLIALRLEGNTINEAAATAIGKALEKHSEIERLIWNDLFTTRLKTEVPPSLIKLTQGLITNGCHIVEINLSDNAFGPIGVEGLKTFLSSSPCYTLQELRLNNCGMGIGGGKLLAEALIACHMNSKGQFALRQFVAGRNRLENEGAQALAEAFQIIKTLEVIRMPQNGIRPPGIEALTNSFIENRNLRIIDLNDNTITLAASKLALAIEQLPNLEIINLESSLIRTKGALAIARAIVSHKNLKELYLGCNEMNTEGGIEIAHVVKNMSNLKTLDLNGNCFGLDGIEQIRNILENKTFLNQMIFSDDEGSEQDEEEEEEEDNDEDYEDEEDDDDTESPSFFYGNNPIQKQAWNMFQMNSMKTSLSEQKTGFDLSSLLANVSVCSPTNCDINENKWNTLINLDKMKEYLQSDEQSVDRAVKLLEEIWNDKNIIQTDSSIIAGNVFNALNWNSDNERHFNERLLVSLGFLKDEQTGRQRRILIKRDLIFRTFIDIHEYLPKSTKNILSIFIENAPNDQNQCSLEIQQQLLSSFREF